MTREMTFEEEYTILQKEATELFDKEDEESEPSKSHCVVRRALRCIKKLIAELEPYKEEKCNKSVYLANKSVDKIDAVNKGYADGYNKAIDDLFEDANEMAMEIDTGTYTMKAIGIGLLEQIAEQLKAGGENEKERNAFYNEKQTVQEVAEEFATDTNVGTNGWIACSERLPEIDGNTSDTVLVCSSNGFQYMAFWCGDLKWRFCECGMAKEPVLWTEIVAWQPLPEPFKERD